MHRPSASRPSPQQSSAPTRHRPNQRPRSETPPSGFATSDDHPLASLLNAASAANQASGAVHNIAAHVDRAATTEAWNGAHRAFLYCRCEVRKRHDEKALEGAHRMVTHLEALLVLARQADRWPDHLAAGERTLLRLREALAGAAP